MANMSYCIFENTSNDLSQCIGELQDAVDNGVSTTDFKNNLSSSYERAGFESLVEQCRSLLELIEAMDSNPNAESAEEENEEE